MPTLPNWLPGSAVAVPVLVLVVEDCKMAEEHTMQPWQAEEAAALKRMGSPVVMGPKRELASPHCCCLHRR